LPELAQWREGLYLVPQLAQGVHLLPLDALRTFNLAFTRSKARRTFSLSRLHSLKGEEDFFSCLKMHESAEGFCTTGTSNRRKMMRSLKLLTTATDRRETTGTSKSLTIATDRRKTMGTLKLLTIEACNMTLMLPYITYE